MNEIIPAEDDFYGAVLLIDGEYYRFDFDDYEIKKFKNGKFKKFRNEFIKSHGIDRLALLGMSLRKMIKIIDNLREEAENE